MKNFLVVAVADASEQLVGEALHDHRVHPFFFAVVAHKLLQVVLEVLEDQDEFAVGMDDFSQPHHVGV